ncbi:putative MFS family arabinose efflux permease [Idiomarina loihiensis]|uniref:MFS transporter n=1 Tax=Idiomarina TaxID=135575 RepID=UPI000D710136|nr:MULTISPECIES: MFS transporter [Idiomarina]PWW40316.1 putative MFS family arabinose efflux permease [Idiomarina loihiensis]TDP50007.1 putative MFS family arabinose efflux permease [Idiomarina loihiensis]TDS24641.1 putative MFS family arabinose efflux permease [Idiomarina sp. H2]
MRHENKALASVLLLVCVSYIGVALPYPILAPLFIGATPAKLADFMRLPPELLLGLVLAAYPLGMFLGGHVLGALADHLGRKPVIRWTQIGVCLSYLLSGYALLQQQYLLLLFSRLLTGLFEGNIAIARSIAADLSHAIPKTTSFSYIHAAVYIGYLIGPLLGGALLYHSASTPFYFAAALALVGLGYFERMFQETHSRTTDAPVVTKFNAWILLRRRTVRQLCLINTLSALAFSTFYQFYPLYLVKIYDFGSDGIALLTGVLTVSLIFSSLVMVKVGKKYLSLAANIIWSLTFYGLLGSAMMLVNNHFAFYVLFTLLGLFIVTSGTNMGVYVSDHTPADEQGKLMGLLASLSAIGTVLSILLGSFLATFSPYYPMIGSVLFAAVALLLFMRLHLQNDVAPSDLISTAKHS